MNTMLKNPRQTPFYLLAYAASVLIFAAAQLAAAQPNIVFILTDDLGYGDLSCYNPESDIATPHIDALAKEGVRLTQFYAASNVCGPSRRAILTGRYPSRLGEWAEAYRGTPDDAALNPKDEPCFPLFLKKAGYVNGMFGKWNVGSVNGVSTPDAQGFDYWIGSHHNTSYFGHRNGGSPDFWENGKPAPQYVGQFADDVFVDKAIDFIRDNRDPSTRSGQAKPFFVYLSLFTPHAPFQDPADPNEADRPDLAVYNQKGAKSTGPPHPKDRPVVKKMVEHVDRRIGDLLQTLTDLGIEDNTLVIFTSDNGGMRAAINQPLSGFKQQMLEGGIRVPSMIKWPAKIPAGKTSGQAGISMDFTRTILAAAGAEKHIPKGRELDGVDLMPLLTGETEETVRSLFWRRREWRPGDNGDNTVWTESLLKGEWKYIKEFKQGAGYGRAQIAPYNEQGFAELLFHLEDDIAEKKNLAAEHPEKLAALRTEFEQWRAKTVDRHRHYQIPVADQYGAEPFVVGADKQTRKAATVSSAGTFQLAEIFSSHMILQREVPVPVWGQAPDGTTIIISFKGKKLVTTSRNGRWRVTLPPMPASAEPAEMIVSARGPALIANRPLSNILVGDVWLASGQSNMEMQLAHAAGGPEAAAAAANPNLRHFIVPRADMPVPPRANKWHVAGPRNVGSQSAVGYFFASEIQRETGIPVGLLHSSFGGTVTETWCPPEVMEQPWPEWQAWQQKAVKNPKVPAGNQTASYLYQRMIEPLTSFPVKGVIWYQGEGNASRADEQKRLLPAMIQGWRRAWGNEQLPFYFVQLARYEAADWHAFRTAQLDVWKNTPHTHMAVTIDLSKEPGNHPIHPKTKAPIGHRLALAARAKVYGENDLVHSGPVIRQAEMNDASVVLSFDHVGSGLTAFDGQALRGFFLSPDGKTFHPAKATIKGETVILSSPDLPKPTTVRYAAEADMGRKELDVNLANREGLPASPFTRSIIQKR